jgi:hypothetical protein
MESAESHTAPCLPIDDDWVGSGWEAPIASADRLTARGTETALTALRSTFPPSLVPSLREERHPIVAHQFTNTGRLALLELGLAIACIPAEEDDIQRLRDPAECEGVAAELRAALMFLRAGARVMRPPRTGRERCEYIAVFPSGEQFAIEVKFPSTGDRELDASRVGMELFMSLMGRLAWLSSKVRGARATFHFAPSIVDLGDRHGVNRNLLAQSVDDAVARVSAAIGLGGHLKSGQVWTGQNRPALGPGQGVI